MPETLPPHPSAEEPVAAVDIGTNTVRLLILGHDGQELEREMHVTRLGQNVDRAGVLSDEAIERTAVVLQKYRAALDRHDARRVRVAATSAARDAGNRIDFFRRVRAVLGHDAELLSGDDEARLSFLGATSTLSALNGPILIFDIGGGSTEFARGERTPQRFVSLDVGAVRITERFLTSDPPQPAELERATAHVRTLLETAARVIAPDGTETWIGLAGTVTTFAAQAAGLRAYDAQITHGFRLERQAVVDFSEQLWATPCEARRALLTEPKRAEVIIGGALVLRAIFEYFDLRRITVSERDILDGLAMSLLGDGPR